MRDSAVPDTTVCGVGYVVSGVGTCVNTYGPCAISDYNGSIPAFATRCLSCFSDANLLLINTAFVCIPNACTALTDANTCGACQPGYSLTANRSCILNFVSTGISINSETDNSYFVTASLIISATAIICVILCFVLKLAEQWIVKQYFTKKSQSVSTEIKGAKRSGNILEAENSLVFVQQRSEIELA